MSNMLDYIAWRGDLSFTEVPLNEVDGLILAQLAMMRWEQAYTGAERLRELAARMTQYPVSTGFTGENDRKLIAAVGASARFGELTLSDYVHETDAEAEKQFAAITLHLPDGALYIAFRGTDATLVGWKEDCAMAFSRPVPAQEEAVRYLTAVAAQYTGTLYVGGHSKGGNLAMFAATGVEDDVRARIVTVFNYDGPGLSDRMDAASLYARIAGRLRSFVPQGSVVGLLLAHPDEYTVVESVFVSVFQHDPYSWQVMGPAFLRLPALSAASQRFDLVFRQWLRTVDEQDRMELVETLFSVLSATNARSFGREFWAGLAKNPVAVYSAFSGVDPATRARVLKMIAELGRLAIVRPPEEQPKLSESQT